MAMSGLGRVNITSGGTIQALNAVNTAKARVQWLRIQAAVGNTGVVYVGMANMVKATGVGVLGVVGIPPATGALPAFEINQDAAPGGADLSQIYIDGTTNEGVYVTFG